MNSNLSVFDRPQVESDVIADVEDPEFDPDSTRLLWDGRDEVQLDESDQRNNRLAYLARGDDNAGTICLIVANSNALRAYAMACSPGGYLELSLNNERYMFVATEMDGEAEGWENLADGLWRKR